MLFLRVTDDDEKDAVKSWWATLPRRLQDEWLSIEWAWKNESTVTLNRMISMDWIEDHGGERLWWTLMNVYETSPSAAE